MLADKHRLKLPVAGIAPLSHFTFSYENALVLKALFVQLMLERGFLASTSFYSMYAHQLSDVEKYLSAADDAFGIIAQSLRTGESERLLKGKPSTAGFKRLT